MWNGKEFEKFSSAHPTLEQICLFFPTSHLSMQAGKQISWMIVKKSLWNWAEINKKFENEIYVTHRHMRIFSRVAFQLVVKFIYFISNKLMRLIVINAKFVNSSQLVVAVYFTNNSHTIFIIKSSTFSHARSRAPHLMKSNP
jgi:hypothetical protein